MCKYTSTALESERECGRNNPTSLVQRTGPTVAATSFWPDQTRQGEGICWSSGSPHLLWECFLWRVIYSSPARWALKVPRPHNLTARLFLPFFTPRVVLCTPPRRRHLNKWQGIDCQITTKTPQQSGRQKTVFTLVAAIHFPGRCVYKDVSFEHHDHNEHNCAAPPSDLDNLATFHLHQLAKVLLEEAGVGAPLQQTKKVH